ncbi:hypothetical protein [Kordiimonas aquimaris]|uniref:hypothetical protein n=1 Tax=Kordiimonas aquimaris TaxID=707591 RepID=UPI0021D2F2DA|nr:hypothetical protein [Kordiimonas aquimaris]
MNQSRLNRKVIAVSAILFTSGSLAGFLISGVSASSMVADVSQISSDTIANDEPVTVQSLDEALLAMKLALEDVQANLNHTTRRIDKASLNSARKKLLVTIKALEWQRNNLIENKTKLGQIEEKVKENHLTVEETRQAIKQQVEEHLNAQTEDLAGARDQILAELERTREELADEIEQLQMSIEEQNEMRVDRLNALREAEMTIADMEKQHLSAIQFAEEQLKRTRQKLEHKLQEQSALNDKFKHYSRSAEN